VTKLWASLWENDCRESCSGYNLRGEGVALQVVDRRVALYVEPYSANALEESLLREYLLVLIGTILRRYYLPPCLQWYQLEASLLKIPLTLS
jgi:hypothetical protein